MDKSKFKAPWGTLLSLTTILSISVTFTVIYFDLIQNSFPEPMKEKIGFLMLLLVPICAIFIVRGYEIEDNELILNRLGWNTTISLDGLQKVTHTKDLLKKSIRVGNGGFFVFSGWFWSKKLGWFQVAGNDILGRAVLLDFENKKWIVTPENPNEFVSILNEKIKTHPPLNS